MHVITKYKQQLGKLLFVFHWASRLYNYHAALRNRRPISSHATSKMPKSDVLLSPFHDALILQHLLHWQSHWQSVMRSLKGGPQVHEGDPRFTRGTPDSRGGPQVHEGDPRFTRGTPGSRWGPHVTRRLAPGGAPISWGPQNFMTPDAFHEDSHRKS